MSTARHVPLQPIAQSSDAKLVVRAGGGQGPQPYDYVGASGGPKRTSINTSTRAQSVSCCPGASSTGHVAHSSLIAEAHSPRSPCQRRFIVSHSLNTLPSLTRPSLYHSIMTRPRFPLRSMSPSFHCYTSSTAAIAHDCLPAQHCPIPPISQLLCASPPSPTSLLDRTHIFPLHDR